MILDKKHLYFDNYNARFYKYDKELYKIFNNYVSERLENQIVYNQLLKSELDYHIVLPTGLVYDDKKWLTGYKMRFVNGNNLDKEIYQKNLSFEEKIFLINEFFELLKQIHQYLVVGDIRNNNLMIGKNKKAYIIDLDYAKTCDSSAATCCKYHICYQDECLNDKNEDIIKMFISALSLLYNYNLENNINNRESIEKLERFIPLSGYLKEYYYYLLNNVYKHQKTESYLKINYDSSIEKDINSAKSRILVK